VRNYDGSNSQISQYTKPYLEGTDDGVSGTNMMASLFVPKQPQPSESVDKKSLQLADNEATPSTGGIVPIASTRRAADSPYVPLPAAGSDLPISPYSCIEQTTNDSAYGSQAGPQDAVIAATEGTKCDGYVPVPWSSTQPSV